MLKGTLPFANYNSTRQGIFWTLSPRKRLPLPGSNPQIPLPLKPSSPEFWRGRNLRAGGSRVGGTASVNESTTCFLTHCIRLLSRIGGQRSMGEVLLWLGVCVAAILIAYWIFRRWFRAARMEEMALQSAGVPVRSWQQWIFASRAAAAQGDYRMAIHCAYWAGIARLEELGALPADRAKTPREYLRALTKANLLISETQTTRYQALSMLTSRLEKIWYGYHIATETDFRDSLAQLEVLGCHLP